MTITKEQIVETISEMSVKNVMELVSAIEKKFNVSATLAMNAAAHSPVREKIEKTEFNVFLQKIGPNKIAVIKAIRNATNLGLKESKDLVESAPVLIKERISKEEANNLKQSLEGTGAIIEIK